MTEIYNKETLNHDYPIISCLKSFNFCLKEGSAPFFFIHLLIFSQMRSNNDDDDGDGFQRSEILSLSPPFSPIPQGFVGDNPLGD